jgi:hypothetical protein
MEFYPLSVEVQCGVKRPALSDGADFDIRQP